MSQSLASLDSSATAPLMSRDRPVTCSLAHPTGLRSALGQLRLQHSRNARCMCVGPHGFIWRVRSTISGRCVPILGIWPGERQFTWMPCAASSTASERVKFTLHGESQGDQRVTGGEVVATDPGARGAGRGLRRTTAPLAAW